MEEISNEKWQEVAEYLSSYGVVLDGALVKECIHGDELIMEEIRSGGYTDTMGTDLIMDTIALKLVGMEWPMFGDSDEYKINFYKAAMECGLIPEKK